MKKLINFQQWKFEFLSRFNLQQLPHTATAVQTDTAAATNSNSKIIYFFFALFFCFSADLAAGRRARWAAGEAEQAGGCC